MNINTGSNRISTLIVGDLVYIGRTSDGTDKAIEKTDFNTYIQTVAASSLTTTVIGNGVASVIALGAVATYEGFEVDFIYGGGTDRAKIKMDFIYDSSTDYASMITITGTLTSGVNIEDSLVAAGQFFWRVTNNSGASITIKHKITQFDAI